MNDRTFHIISVIVMAVLFCLVFTYLFVGMGKVQRSAELDRVIGCMAIADVNTAIMNYCVILMEKYHYDELTGPKNEIYVNYKILIEKIKEIAETELIE